MIVAVVYNLTIPLPAQPLSALSRSVRLMDLGIVPGAQPLPSLGRWIVRRAVTPVSVRQRLETTADITSRGVAPSLQPAEVHRVDRPERLSEQSLEPEGSIVGIAVCRSRAAAPSDCR